MANWKEMFDASMSTLGALGQGNPGIMQGLQNFSTASRSKNALDEKTRELIALAVAATTRCESCIAIHAAEAVKAGASRDEVLETLAVAVALNAGAATVFSSRILEAFDQFSNK